MMQIIKSVILMLIYIINGELKVMIIVIGSHKALALQKCVEEGVCETIHIKKKTKLRIFKKIKTPHYDILAYTSYYSQIIHSETC